MTQKYYFDSDGDVFFNTNEITSREVSEEVLPPITDAQFNEEQAVAIKTDMIDTLSWITSSITSGQFTDAQVSELETIRDEIWDLRDLPGTPTDILAAMTALISRTVAIIGFKFRFQA